MDRLKFEDELRALNVCAQCLNESAKPRLSLLRCTGCRMVLYCSKAHQTEHWKDHKAFCKARRKKASEPESSASVVRPRLPSARCADTKKEETEAYVSVCDAAGVFCILGMFWKNGKASLCNLSIRLGQINSACEYRWSTDSHRSDALNPRVRGRTRGQRAAARHTYDCLRHILASASTASTSGVGPIAVLLAPLPDWEPRTRVCALKTLTVQGSADYIRVSLETAVGMARRALNERRDSPKRGTTRRAIDGMPDGCRVGINLLINAAGRDNTKGVSAGGGLAGENVPAGAEKKEFEEFLASEEHEAFEKALTECCDDGKTLDIFFFGLLNERREFRDCYSFLEGLASLGGAENFEEALRKLADQGNGDKARGTARLCAHACLCFFLAGLRGLASAMHIAKEGCENDFVSSPFVRAMLYRTKYRNAAGEVVVSPKPELSERYQDEVVRPLLKAMEATGAPLVQLTPVSFEIKDLLEEGVLL